MKGKKTSCLPKSGTWVPCTFTAASPGTKIPLHSFPSPVTRSRRTIEGTCGGCRSGGAVGGAAHSCGLQRAPWRCCAALRSTPRAAGSPLPRTAPSTHPTSRSANWGRRWRREVKVKWVGKVKDWKENLNYSRKLKTARVGNLMSLSTIRG